MPEATDIQKQESTAIQPERTRGGRAFVPNVDIAEVDDRLLLLADMPGVKAEDVDIHYERGQLSIHGRVTPRQDPDRTDFILTEYGVGDFYRSFQVGENIDIDRIDAEVRDGVLMLNLPKSKESLPRKITVKTS